MKTRKPNEVPASLKHIDVKALLRSRGMYVKQKVYQDIKEAAIPVARQLVKSRRSKAIKAVEPRRYHSFSNEEALAYWEKQVRVIDVIEKKFEAKIQQYVVKIAEGFLSSIEEEISTKQVSKLNKSWFDDNEAELVARAQLDFTPLLVNQAVVAGAEALKLIKSDEIYLPELLRSKITENVAKFAESLIDTDRELLNDLLFNGLSDGKSVPEIREQIRKEFEEQYSKTQAERITRTEVARVSNQAALDAWEQSGVVEGKQWVTFGAVDECAKYDGEVVSLSGSFYGSKTEFQDGDPPLHPNCRCGTIPILIGEKALVPEINKKLYERIEELEAQMDKRTKAYKELKSTKHDDELYIKSLEKHLGIEDE